MADGEMLCCGAANYGALNTSRMQHADGIDVDKSLNEGSSFESSMNESMMGESVQYKEHIS